MSPSESRLKRIESELVHLSHTVGSIEREICREKKQPKSKWDVLAIFIPVIQGLLLAVVGYLLTDSVNRVLKERELDLSNVKEMRELIHGLYKSTDSDEANASALTLTAFRRHAVAPLINALEGDANQHLAAERALRAMGAVEPILVCSAVARIVANRMQLYAAETHLSAIRLVGSLGCQEAVPALRDFKLAVGDGGLDEAMPRFREIVGPPEPTKDNLKDVRTELDRSLQRLSR